jgi:hypothetical protein
MRMSSCDWDTDCTDEAVMRRLDEKTERFRSVCAQHRAVTPASGRKSGGVIATSPPYDRVAAKAWRDEHDRQIMSGWPCAVLPYDGWRRIFEVMRREQEAAERAAIIAALDGAA